MIVMSLLFRLLQPKYLLEEIARQYFSRTNTIGPCISVPLLPFFRTITTYPNYRFLFYFSKAHVWKCYCKIILIFIYVRNCIVNECFCALGHHNRWCDVEHTMYVLFNTKEFHKMSALTKLWENQNSSFANSWII